METLKEYIIPIEGLRNGVQQFDFQLDRSFFEHFQHAPIQDGNFDLKLQIDKRPDMLVLAFEYTGSLMTECDRCLESIKLPVSDKQQLLVKYGEEAKEDAEIIYITKETKLLNVAKYAYECACLAIPIIKNCDDMENPPCNDKMLDYLDGTDESPKADNSIWEALKKFKKD